MESGKLCKRCGGAEFYEYPRIDKRKRNPKPRIERKCKSCANRSSAARARRSAWKRNNRAKIRDQEKRRRDRLRERIAAGDQSAIAVRENGRNRALRRAAKVRALRPPKNMLKPEQSAELRRAKGREKYWADPQKQSADRIAAQQRAMDVFRAALDLGLVSKKNLRGLGLSRGERKAYRKREYHAAARAMRELGLVPPQPDGANQCL